MHWLPFFISVLPAGAFLVFPQHTWDILKLHFLYSFGYMDINSQSAITFTVVICTECFCLSACLLVISCMKYSHSCTNTCFQSKVSLPTQRGALYCTTWHWSAVLFIWRPSILAWEHFYCRLEQLLVWCARDGLFVMVWATSNRGNPNTRKSSSNPGCVTSSSNERDGVSKVENSVI